MFEGSGRGGDGGGGTIATQFALAVRKVSSEKNSSLKGKKCSRPFSEGRQTLLTVADLKESGK